MTKQNKTQNKTQNTKKVTSYEPCRNENFNHLKLKAINFNGEHDMHAMLLNILKNPDIKELLKNKVLKVIKTHDMVWFLTIHASNPLNKVACYKLFKNKKAYNKIYKNMPIVNYVTNRLKTLSLGMTFNHAMIINENLKNHLITDKRKFNKKWYYAIGLSNSMIEYKKFNEIIGHKYHNKDNVKQVTRLYSIENNKRGI